MKVLVCGAKGFVGAALCQRLARAGHTVVKGVREPRSDDEIAIDYRRDLAVDQWLPKLVGIDAVVNAVGILVERGSQRFDEIHRRAPMALFRACAAAGVQRVVQVSVLGAQQGGTAYFDSKFAADTFLLTQPIEWQIVRPALIYGAAGKSARLFRMLASLPVQALPAGGHQPLQPVHIDDLTDVVAKLLEPSTAARQCLDVVGATPVDFREMMRTYRESMRLPATLSISIPGALIGAAAAVLDRVPGSTLTRETWRMLQHGNVGDPEPMTRLLGRSPRRIDTFIQDDATARNEALAAWRPVLLRGALACVWIGTALVSAFAYPTEDSLALLQRVHINGMGAWAALYGAILLDLLFGITTLTHPGRRLWALQGALILTYSIIIGIALPEFLSHPFGPVLKNLPILAILILLFSEETKR
jgi:uncharacterized protein YbjT (DUF2867 family)